MPVLQAHSIVAALRAAFCQDVARQQLLQQAADRIQAAGPPYTSAYLYMVHDSELRLEAYAGRPTEHTTIPVGKGICGSAVASGVNQNVGDVTARDEYLAKFKDRGLIDRKSTRLNSSHTDRARMPSAA